MIVYVESNFVLELALEQEQSPSCIDFLKLAKSKTIRLVIPAFSLAEPQVTLNRRKQDRHQLKQNVDHELQQLKRTASYLERINEFSDITAFLTESGVQESVRLQGVVSELVECAEVISFDSAVAVSAIQLESRHGLSSLDALVYASVLAHLSIAAHAESCFITRDAKGFDVTGIVNELKTLNCRLFRHFDDGLSFVKSKLNNPSTP